MDREEFIDKITNLDGESEIFIETDENNYRVYDLSWEDEDVDEGTYKCNVLGNWYYTDIMQLAVDLYDKLVETYEENIISVETE